MRQILLSLLIVHIAACSSFHRVAIRDVSAESGSSPVQIGDRVEVTTLDSETLQFAVTDITAEGISGRFGFVRFDDMRSLSVRRSGEPNDDTVTWILGILGAAALIALVASADSVTACSGTPCPDSN